MNDPSIFPGLVMRVAVTGHRDIDPVCDPAIRESIRKVFHELFGIADRLMTSDSPACYTGVPSFRILSQLAEGADRLVAQEALGFASVRNVSVECPLPAAVDEYRRDFSTEASRKDFDSLLESAAVRFALDGQRRGEWLRSSDYARAGHVSVSNCDLLIAIWDGEGGKQGGTGSVVLEATQNGIPTLRIDDKHPESITVCTGHDRWESQWRAALERNLFEAFEPPKLAFAWLKRYSDEKMDATSEDGVRADLLAKRFGDRYRLSYRLKYGLSAIAVLFAVIGMINGQEEAWWWPASEIAAIGGILLCFALARKASWHDRWLDYRLLAEQFRVLEFLHPLGESVPQFRPPKYWGVPTERHAAVRWYFRARSRRMSLPHAVVTPDYIASQRAKILRVAKGQLAYNIKKHKSVELRHRIVEGTGVMLFLATAIACTFHLVHWGPGILLGALTATLPAFGAAMEGIQAQDEGKRIAGNTGAMAQHMKDVKSRIEVLTPEGGFEPVRLIAFELATEMTRETSGWHNLIHSQAPKI